LPWLLLGVAGAGLALTVWALTLAGTALACTFENTECAASHAVREYRGRLFDYAGRPARHKLLFRSGLYGDDFEGSISTDGGGRFCVRAVEGRTSAFIAVAGQSHASQLVVRSSAPVDPRFAAADVLDALRGRATDFRGPDRMPFLAVEPSNPGAISPSPSIHPIGAYDAAALWDPKSDTAASCEELGAKPPWYRFEDSGRSRQFVVLNLAPLAALGLFVFGVAAGVSARRRPSPERANVAHRAFQATAAAAGLSLVVFLVLWSII
jgi:hypothetical protein